VLYILIASNKFDLKQTIRVLHNSNEQGILIEGEGSVQFNSLH
jgi:hypothetical protein